MIAAFFTGLLGSLHCLGMCGPLAFALPAAPVFGMEGQAVKAGPSPSHIAGRLLYNVGRLVSYAFLGAMVSMVGVAAAMFDLQRYASLLMGGILILLAIRGFLRHGKSSSPSSPVFKWLSSQMGRFLGNPHPMNLFTIGLLNGLLPCGLVYIGLFQAALAPSPFEGMAIMALFGLGTFPMMIGVSLSGPWLRRNLMGRVRRVLPILMLITGVMLSLRGMALGIPYLSPKMEQAQGGAADIVCCEPIEDRF